MEKVNDKQPIKQEGELVEFVKDDIKRKPTKYRTEDGLRKQSYKRFKEGIDY